MASVDRLSGTDARLKLAGSVWGKFRNVEFNPRKEFAKGRAAGDPVMVNVPLWQDFELRGTVIADLVEPYPMEAANALGTSVAWVVLIVSTHVNGFLSGEGYISECPIRVPHDDVVEFMVTVIPNGNVPTFTASPA